MKKTLLALAMLASANAYAQIPNGSFENGNGNKPTSWRTTDDVERVSTYSTTHGGQTVNVNPYAGGHFLRLTTVEKNVGGQQKAVLSTATVMLPDIGNPDSIQFTSIYFPKIQDDNFRVEIDFVKYNNGQQQVMMGTSFGGAVNQGTSWQTVTRRFSYPGGYKPDYDSLRIRLRSANQSQHDPQTMEERFGVGATLLIDDLRLFGGTVGVYTINPKGPSVNVYPNPTTGTTYFSTELQQQGPVTLSLYDLNGRVVRMLANELVPAGKYQLSLDMTGLEPGMYFYQLSAKEGLQSGKLMVSE